MKFEVIEGKERHCGQISRLLRVGHREVVARFGVDTHRELRARFDDSAFRRAWMIDGQLAALGGVTGPILASTGFLWLAVSNKAMEYPVAMVREARKQLDQICVIKHEIVTTLMDGDEESKRFAVFLGFVPEGMEPASSRFGRRIISQHIGEIPRVPIGTGCGVIMAYHGGS
jgi:hypothetical protein